MKIISFAIFYPLQTTLSSMAEERNGATGSQATKIQIRYSLHHLLVSPAHAEQHDWSRDRPGGD